MARITRKELKTDKFALEVGQTLSFFEEHRQELIRYGTVAIVVAALVFGFISYRRHQKAAREEALSRAIQVQETPVGPVAPGSPATNNFPTQQVKDETAVKVFTDVRNKYSGTNEAEIAEYFLGAIRADQGNLAEAAKDFQEVAQKGDQQYASLAKLSLAQVYFSQGKSQEGENLLRDLMAHPTMFVSKDQAAITLARALLPTKPDESRKILDSLRNQPTAAGQVALQMYSQLPPK